MSPGRELDAMVAEKVMGWKRMTYEDAYPPPANYAGDKSLTFYWHTADGKEGPRTEPSDCIDCGTDFPAWAPSTSIADAWEVVERVNAISKFTRDFALFKDFWGEGKYGYRAWFRKDSADNGVEYMEDGETAPHAICMAALKAIGAI